MAVILIRNTVFAGLAALCFAGTALAQTAHPVTRMHTQDITSKVVYHIDSTDQPLKALRNIRNHLDVAPQTSIVVVTHANGVVRVTDLQTQQGFAYIKP